MADGTAIAWAHATINAISGCTPVSPGCTNCYAMRAGSHKRPHHPSNGLTQPSRAGHVWTGAVRLNEDWLRKPLSWSKPRRIFWNAHGDPWHESVPFEWVDQEMAVAALTPQHRHLFLTKRSGRMRRYFDNPATPERILDAAKQLKGLPSSWTWPLPNVWLGVSVEDQPRANERIPDLLATPAAVHWLSCEPLLAPIFLLPTWLPCTKCQGRGWYLARFADNHRTACDVCASHAQAAGITILPGQMAKPGPRLKWLVVGGDSGQGARPMHPDWDRGLRDQCSETGVPYLFKQWGEWAPVCEMSAELIDSCYRPAPKQHPEATRPCKVDYGALHADGTWFGGKAMFERGAFEQGSRAMSMFSVGKRAAGRLLDGVLHDEFPELFAWEIAERAARLKELADA